MLVYVLRHGIAEAQRDGRPDAERELTAEGVEKLERVLRRCRKAGVAPSLIASSPLVRAMQTAEKAVGSLGYKGSILRSDALLPDAQPAAVWKELRRRRSEESVLLTGHEPQMSALVAYLLGAPDLRVEMKKGAMACVDIERMSGEPKGVLRWLLPPRLS